MIGLYKAVRDFRHDKETSFRSFAELCVTRQIITAIKTATRFKHAPLNTYVSFSHTPAGQDNEGELSAHEVGVAHCTREHERAFERREHVVGDVVGSDGGSRRVHDRSFAKLLGEALAPCEHGAGDHVVRPVLEELAIEDVRDVQAARLLRDHLVGGILEHADERHDLGRRIVARGLGAGHELLEERDVARRVPLDEGPRQVMLGGEVVQERALARIALGQDRVDRRRREALLEDQALGTVENSLACLSSASGHLAHRS
jgi:hypothetical protein